MEIFDEIKALCQGAKAAAYTLATKSGKERNDLLLEIAKELRLSSADIISANKIDLSQAKDNGIPMLIINGEYPYKLYEILDGKHIGTYFAAKKSNRGNYGIFRRNQGTLPRCKGCLIYSCNQKRKGTKRPAFGNCKGIAIKLS